MKNLLPYRRLPISAFYRKALGKKGSWIISCVWVIREKDARLNGEMGGCSTTLEIVGEPVISKSFDRVFKKNSPFPLVILRILNPKQTSRPWGSLANFLFSFHNGSILRFRRTNYFSAYWKKAWIWQKKMTLMQKFKGCHIVFSWILSSFEFKVWPLTAVKSIMFTLFVNGNPFEPKNPARFHLCGVQMDWKRPKTPRPKTHAELIRKGDFFSSSCCC